MGDGTYNPPWSGRRAQRALAYVKAHGRANRTPCVICEQPIDYSLEYPDPWSCTVQHKLSQRAGVELGARPPGVQPVRRRGTHRRARCPVRGLVVPHPKRIRHILRRPERQSA